MPMPTRRVTTTLRLVCARAQPMRPRVPRAQWMASAERGACTAGVESEVEEEYDEGHIVDEAEGDERPPFDDEPASVDPALVAELDAAEGDEEAEGDEYVPPGAESEVEEEYDEGAVRDDERPPFDGEETEEPPPRK